MNAAQLRAKLATATERETLAALYVEVIGYDPFEDCSSNTVESVRETLYEAVAELESQEEDAALRSMGSGI